MTAAAVLNLGDGRWTPDRDLRVLATRTTPWAAIERIAGEMTSRSEFMISAVAFFKTTCIRRPAVKWGAGGPTTLASSNGESEGPGPDQGQRKDRHRSGSQAAVCNSAALGTDPPVSGVTVVRVLALRCQTARTHCRSSIDCAGCPGVPTAALRAGRADSPPLHIPSGLCLTGWSIG